MKNTRNIKGFTLIELLVVIAITIILFTAWSNINFNKISDKQELSIFNNQIISQFETVRNHALLWKWVELSIFIPESWELEYSVTWSGEINVSYLSGATYLPYSEYNITAPDFHSITNINCLDSNSIILGASTPPVTMIIQWNDISISSWCVASTRKLQFTSTRKWFSEIIEINTLNWVIQTL